MSLIVCGRKREEKNNDDTPVLKARLPASRGNSVTADKLYGFTPEEIKIIKKL